MRNPPEPAAADLAHCRTLLRGGSRSFHAASFLLPARVRDPAVALYAFCRVADDAVDGASDAAAALRGLRRRLDLAYAGRPLERPEDRAFADVVARFELPRALPEALLEGFGWDAAGRRYATLAELEGYAARVAGSVGAMMAIVMRRRSAATLARACELGVAMQLTNIARDVGEDARAGRLYLPLDWLAEAGLDGRRFLARPEWTPALGRVVARLLAEAERLYARAAPGIADLPADCRPAIHAARLLYAEIGRAVERAGLDSVGGRARVGAGRKGALLLRAGAAALAASGAGGAGPASLPAVRFLVDAAQRAQDMPAAAGVAARLVRILELFAELERRERQRA